MVILGYLYFFSSGFLPFLVPVLEHVLQVKSSLPSDVEEYFKEFVTKLLEERRKSSEVGDFQKLVQNLYIIDV